MPIISTCLVVNCQGLQKQNSEKHWQIQKRYSILLKQIILYYLINTAENNILHIFNNVALENK